MKNVIQKSILLLLFISITTSCSKENEEPEPELFNKVEITVNGEKKLLNAILIDRNTPDIIKITASMTNNSDAVLKVVLFKNKTGSDALSEFSYTSKGVLYDSPLSASFNFIVSASDSPIKATFSGEVQESSGGTGLIEITDGLIDIKSR